MVVKTCFAHRRLLAIGFVAVSALGFWTGPAAVSGAPQQVSPQTIVTLRWGARPGVTRYRLQLANDADFGDIVFDRVVTGQEYRLSGLEPGRYYWRVASLNAKLGEFSSAGVIDVPANPVTVAPRPTPLPTTGVISSRGGWYAAIGAVSKSILARVSSPNSSEVVALTNDGRVVALDATRGIALWTVRISPVTNAQVVAIRAGSGSENVLLLVRNSAMLIDGRTGRELWRTNLPGNGAAAVASATKVVVIDDSFQKMFVIDSRAGTLTSQARLTNRAVGTPVAIDYQRTRAVMIALADGGLHLFDESGKLMVAASAGSPATTAPVIVQTSRGDLVLVGTRSGLTALTADELKPLGRVTLKDDAPSGTLTARDLDGDGRAEVIMFTERGRVMVVKSDEGRILWEADALRAESAAFGDVNGDRVLDLLMAGREGFALALSGRDGSLLWKDAASPVATNHSPAVVARRAFAVPTQFGVLMIAADPFRGGLRAIEFPKR